MNQLNQTKRRVNTRTMTRVSILSVISFFLMYLAFPLVMIAPPFMELDISDVPALIGGFAMGPFVGVAIELIKNLLHLFVHGTKTFAVGELSNFILGASFVLIASTIYQRKKTYKRALIGLFFGTLGMSVLAMISNYFVVFPLYGQILGMDGIIEMGTAVTSNIKDLVTMMIYAVLPFNLVKGLVVTIITLLMYKKVSPLLHD